MTSSYSDKVENDLRSKFRFFVVQQNYFKVIIDRQRVNQIWQENKTKQSEAKTGLSGFQMKTTRLPLYFHAFLSFKRYLDLLGHHHICTLPDTIV